MTRPAMALSSPPFVQSYLQRLGLSATDTNTVANTDVNTVANINGCNSEKNINININKPTFEDLCRITEAHLANIPFENLGQHGAKGGLQTLDMTSIEDKILTRQRGGFCLELNSILAKLLSTMGLHVQYVPAIVHRPDGDDDGFDHPATHLFLLVRLDDHDSQQYFVDVGFGEPAIHPLRYPALDEIQITAEGMQSRFVPDGTDIVLEYKKGGVWTPRLKWDAQIDATRTLEDFAQCLKQVQDVNCNFGQKTIVCSVTRDWKYTVAGSKFKVTGPGRMSMADDGVAPVAAQELSSKDEVRSILESKFGIAMEETETLDMSRSLAAEDKVWATF
eukprot:CAMPEP_0198124972 /NCGR_PEP_ID=MMETSP1442-20131203/41458_1 /TAXON_ID= /ORGANISM="Craspedostauros australis, Strain CCMP3328" /LENGTH=333 /DNA_ID=CAMNT_0043784491 /DNA_START=302 /DNA_END=1303 /DNA_ORIENTATION=-